jgi:hypothetical protein
MCFPAADRSSSAVTFGRASAVLAYMTQEALQGFGWLPPGEMADGLGLADTAPGTPILVTQFVGHLAAFGAPEPFSPFVAGLLAAIACTLVFGLKFSILRVLVAAALGGTVPVLAI